MTDDLVDTALALAQLCGSVEALATGITSITCVDLVSLFLAREDNLVGVDDDDVVATVYMRSECGLVLSAKQLGSLEQRRPTIWSLASTTTHSFLAVSLFTEIVL